MEAGFAAVNARAEQFSRIAAAAREEIDRCSGSGTPRSLDSPRWIPRRRRNSSEMLHKKKETEQEQYVRQVAAIAAGMGEQVGALQRQLQEQSIQLKSLAQAQSSHNSQAELQKQLMNLLSSGKKSNHAQIITPRPQHATKKAHESKGAPSRSASKEYTLTWLNSHQKQGGKVEGASQKQSPRLERPGVIGYKPIRRSSSVVSGSDRTRTTFGGYRSRCFYERNPRSIPTETPPPPKERVGKFTELLQKKKKKKISKGPLVVTLYDRCKRKNFGKLFGKNPGKKKAQVKQEHQTKNERKLVKEVKVHENHEETHPAKTNIKAAPVEDSILESMLHVQRYEDELKHRWLVPDAPEQEKSIGQSIMEEMMKNPTPRVRNWNVVRDTVGRKCPVKEAMEQEPLRLDYREEELVEALMDDALKQVCSEVLTFCDAFVDHLYMSEFLPSGEPD